MNVQPDLTTGALADLDAAYEKAFQAHGRPDLGQAHADGFAKGFEAAVEAVIALGWLIPSVMEDA